MNRIRKKFDRCCPGAVREIDGRRLRQRENVFVEGQRGRVNAIRMEELSDRMCPATLSGFIAATLRIPTTITRAFGIHRRLWASIASNPL